MTTVIPVALHCLPVCYQGCAKRASEDGDTTDGAFGVSILLPK